MISAKIPCPLHVISAKIPCTLHSYRVAYYSFVSLTSLSSLKDVSSKLEKIGWIYKLTCAGLWCLLNDQSDRDLEKQIQEYLSAVTSVSPERSLFGRLILESEHQVQNSKKFSSI